MVKHTPTIETERLILRKFTKADAADAFELLRDAEVNTFLPWFPLKTIEETKDFLQMRFLDSYSEPFGARYAVCLKENNRVIGYVNLSNGEANDFGYALRKEFWHNGYMTEAGSAVLKQIKKMGFPFVTATHDVNNPQSGEVMKRLGFTYRYSYVEQVQPKNEVVTFRLYQLDFVDVGTYLGYWDSYPEHFIEF